MHGWKMWSKYTMSNRLCFAGLCMHEFQDIVAVWLLYRCVAAGIEAKLLWHAQWRPCRKDGCLGLSSPDFFGRELPSCSSDCRLPSGGHQSYVRLWRLKPDIRTTQGLSLESKMQVELLSSSTSQSKLICQTGWEWGLARSMRRRVI